MAMKVLIAQGKKQGFLTYDELNTALPEEMLSMDQVDDTLMMFDDLGIDIIDEKNRNLTKAKTKNWTPMPLWKTVVTRRLRHRSPIR
jgi:hypothetical protein